jgi:hypothetical protein
VCTLLILALLALLLSASLPSVLLLLLVVLLALPVRKNPPGSQLVKCTPSLDF